MENCIRIKKQEVKVRSIFQLTHKGLSLILKNKDQKYFFGYSISLILILSLTLGQQCISSPNIGQRFMITAGSRVAAQCGNEIFEMGGNVADASVAVGFCMSVVAPFYASIGGGGFAMIKMGKEEVEALDFREIAPANTNESYYVNQENNASVYGPKAVAVPGTLAGLWEIHKRYGKLSWKKVMGPALKQASDGHLITGEWAQNIKESSEHLNSAGRSYFMKNKDQFYKPGDLFFQKNYSKALKLIEKKGIRPFYDGEIGQDIVNTVKGGALSLNDLRNYKVRWLKPLVVPYEGHEIYLMPLPSSGGILIGTSLKLIEYLKIKQYEVGGADEYHLLAEIQKAAFLGRSDLGDTESDEVVAKMERWKSEKFISTLGNQIRINKVSSMDKSQSSSTVESREKSQTTNYTVLDSNGNGIVVTLTLNGMMGSGLVTTKYGITLNDEMDDFTTILGKANEFGLIQGYENRVRPGKRPLSSMSPTLIAKNGKVVGGIGAPGGPRIISGVLQVLYRVLGRNYPIDKAIAAPRIHYQTAPNLLFFDSFGMAPEVLKSLSERGHKLNLNSGQNWMAWVNGSINNTDGYLEGSYDPRGEGAAVGR